MIYVLGICSLSLALIGLGANLWFVLFGAACLIADSVMRPKARNGEA